MTMMTQCRLIRNGLTQDAWIESALARKGKFVDIREDGVWTRGWKIVTVGNTQDSKVVAERERDFKNHRKATDV